jgi:hypothetical protein
MKKEYVVTEISASSDGTPFVFVSLKSPEEVGGLTRKPYAAVTFSSMDDVFRNLGHVISNQMMGSFATVIKLSLDEYEKLEIKVGDRISVNINKINVGIP